MCDRAALSNVLRHIHSKSIRDWKRWGERKPKYSDLYNSVISGAFYIYNERELSELLQEEFIQIPNPTDGAVKGVRGRLLLPHIEKEVSYVPLLRLEWDFTEGHLRAHTFSLDMYHACGKVFSIRFDRSSPGSDHNFFHLQINNRIPGCHPDFDNNYLSWLPKEKPCIPLYYIESISPVSILIYIIASLYGFKSIYRLFLGAEVNQRHYTGIESLKHFFEKQRNQ